MWLLLYFQTSLIWIPSVCHLTPPRQSAPNCLLCQPNLPLVIASVVVRVAGLAGDAQLDRPTTIYLYLILGCACTAFTIVLNVAILSAFCISASSIVLNTIPPRATVSPPQQEAGLDHRSALPDIAARL